jgi:phosphate starvation-inducible PhoH-like protein
MTKEAKKTTHLILENNHLALQVFGPNEGHLNYLAETIPVAIKSRGNEVIIEGPADDVRLAEKCLLSLKDRAVRGLGVHKHDVIDFLRSYGRNPDSASAESLLNNVVIAARKKNITPRTIGQKQYVDAIQKYDIVFGVGPAGTGKTYLAMAVALAKLLKGEVERVILTRPAVEAGEKLGFLPGDLAEKVNPYLRPLYDALHEMVDLEKAERLLTTGQIEVAPLAFMRGRTLNDSYVILDEAQNCTREQMKMFLTRLGMNSQAVVTGDVTQIDLPRETKSGLIEAVRVLSDVKGIHIHYFDENDVVRHPLVAEVIKAYDRKDILPKSSK